MAAAERSYRSANSRISLRSGRARSLERSPAAIPPTMAIVMLNRRRVILTRRKTWRGFDYYDLRVFDRQEGGFDLMSLTLFSYQFNDERTTGTHKGKYWPGLWVLWGNRRC